MAAETHDPEIIAEMLELSRRLCEFEKMLSEAGKDKRQRGSARSGSSDIIGRNRNRTTYAFGLRRRSINDVTETRNAVVTLVNVANLTGPP